MWVRPPDTYVGKAPRYNFDRVIKILIILYRVAVVIL